MPQASVLLSKRPNLNTVGAVLRRYPRVCAHIICESLGYATPTRTASILKAVIDRQKHFCEWIAACYGCDPVPAVRNAIVTRRFQKGDMADQETTLSQVRSVVKAGQEPDFVSWF